MLFVSALKRFMENVKMFHIEVVYASPQEQTVITIAASPHDTVMQVIEKSGVLQKHPEIDLLKNKVGIFSRMATLETVVVAGDRIEIYHPLLIDPKSARRHRAKQGFKNVAASV